MSFLKKLSGLARGSLVAASLLLAAILISPPGHSSQASCVMPTSGTVSGLTLVNDINACNGSLLSLYSGASAPGSPTTGMLWFNTTTSYIQQYDGTQWMNIWFVDASNHLITRPIAGGVVTSALSSATTTDIGSVKQAFVQVNLSATPITGFGSSADVGTLHIIQFNGVITLTHNATSLILPGGQPIVTAAGDIAFALYKGSGNWVVLNFSPASGSSVTSAAVPLGTAVQGFFANLPAKYAYGSGQSISRSSFPGYTAAVSRAQSMTRSSGNATLTGVADTSGFGGGMPAEGPGISTGCTVVSVVANTSVTLNNSTCVTASGAATITVYFTGYGVGGDSTTVGVPDCRGRTLAGRDDLNGTAAGRLTGQTGVNNGTGAQSATLVTGNLPPYTPAGSVATTSTTSDVMHTTGLVSTTTGTAGVNFTAGNPSGGTTLSGVSSSGTLTGTAQGGTSTPVSTVQPTLVANCVVLVSP